MRWLNCVLRVRRIVPRCEADTGRTCGILPRIHRMRRAGQGGSRGNDHHARRRCALGAPWPIAIWSGTGDCDPCHRGLVRSTLGCCPPAGGRPCTRSDEIDAIAYTCCGEPPSAQHLTLHYVHGQHPLLPQFATMLTFSDTASMRSSRDFSPSTARRTALLIAGANLLNPELTPEIERLQVTSYSQVPPGLREQGPQVHPRSD